MKPKRKYKDSLFRHLLTEDITRLESLYTAHTGRSPEGKIVIENIVNSFFSSVRHDLAFRVGNQYFILSEHQSTWSENLPLRLLWYVSRLYRNYVKKRDAFKKNPVKIPAPIFLEFYNGTDQAPKITELRLSDAFSGKSDMLELKVIVYNINYAPDVEILQKCETLRGYSMFVAKVRELQAGGETLDEAIKGAIRYCIENDILADYMRKYGKDVYEMWDFEYDEELALEAARDDGREEGRNEGRNEERESMVQKMLTQDVSLDIISKVSGWTAEKILALRNQQPVANA